MAPEALCSQSENWIGWSWVPKCTNRHEPQIAFAARYRIRRQLGLLAVPQVTAATRAWRKRSLPLFFQSPFRQNRVNRASKQLLVRVRASHGTDATVCKYCENLTIFFRGYKEFLVT